MSTAIAEKKLSTRPVELGAHQRARQSKRHPDCRSTTIKLRVTKISLALSPCRDKYPLAATAEMAILIVAVFPSRLSRYTPEWIGDDEPIAPPKEFFAARNGLLHLPTKTLYLPTPSFFGVTASSVAYDPEATEPAQWVAYLRETVADDDAIDALQEWMGYTLSADTSQQKILFCIGPKRSGKGTFARIHTALLGKNSVGGPS